MTTQTITAFGVVPRYYSRPGMRSKERSALFCQRCRQRPTCLSHSNTDGHSNTDRHTNGYTNSHFDEHRHTNSHSDGYTNLYPNEYAY